MNGSRRESESESGMWSKKKGSNEWKKRINTTKKRDLEKQDEEESESYKRTKNLFGISFLSLKRLMTREDNIIDEGDWKEP